MLAAARNRLVPYNVFLSADIFGYVCWNENDTHIGQELTRLAAHLDYISPMLYPSGFSYGLGQLKNTVAHPYAIVFRSLKRARERTRLPAGLSLPSLPRVVVSRLRRRPLHTSPT